MVQAAENSFESFFSDKKGVSSIGFDGTVEKLCLDIRQKASIFNFGNDSKEAITNGNN
ncbi:hypothetical protein [Lactiplantibacillus mudanjiangensis]|uniref:hypothetical protein n=1 Tax=Lactiplantibacillus mudanjiangensis TaxID=1296538 RepID=UPI0013EF2CD3|nr:hypothetical protein [Lactiplantibacillus mudanjiangensis]